MKEMYLYASVDDYLFQWLSKKVLGWLDALYKTEDTTDSSIIQNREANMTNPISSNRDRLSHHLYNVYANR